MRAPAHCKCHRQGGLSLVELLIAMTAGLLLIVATAATYINSKGLFRVGQSVSNIQENGRFALEVLTHDLRLAGFSGCAGTSGMTNLINSPGAFLTNFTMGIQGFDASGNAWQPTLDAAITAGTAVAPTPGTDVITVRRPEGPAFGLSAPWMVNATDNPHADASTVRQAGLQSGHFVLLADCGGGAMFQISNGDVQGTGNLFHATLGTPGNSSASLGKIFGPDALAMRMVTASYFVAPSQILPGNNSLWVRMGSDTPAELAAGVDNLQITYGEDTDGDLTANRYATADQVGDMTNVVSVRISLLMRSLEDNVAQAPQAYRFNGASPVTPSDRRLRVVLTTVVNLRNRTP